MLNRLQSRFDITEVCLVSDRGMISQETIAAPGRAFLRFAPEGNPRKCELELFWTAMGSHAHGRETSRDGRRQEI